MFLGIRNYKCFGSTPQGLRAVAPLNLIIGRNNSGKTALLETVRFITTEQLEAGAKGSSASPELVLSVSVDEQLIAASFPENYTRSDTGQPLREFAKSIWLGAELRWTVVPDPRRDTDRRTHRSLLALEPPLAEHIREPEVRKQIERDLRKHARHPLCDKQYVPMDAARDVLPEPESGGVGVLQANGTGTTSLIQQFHHRTDLDPKLVDQLLLEDLNAIVRPDASFIGIETKRHPDGKWEVYLREDGKGLVPLSASGHGFKSILLVLALLHLAPSVLNRPLSECVFAFEELENNLHPGIQRRLLQYLLGKACSSGATLFLTTHSSVAVDYLVAQENVQLLHLSHDGRQATIQAEETFEGVSRVLSELGGRPSDILQTNVVIWVEGPSDQALMNAWIDLWSAGMLKSGLHYQCVAYGGSLLANAEFMWEDEDCEKLSNLLRLNRRCVVLIDSDLSSGKAELRPTKTRIQKETKATGGICWITAGKEIEHYIPADAIGRAYNLSGLQQVRRYARFDNYLNRARPGLGDSWENDKARFAKRISKTLQDATGPLDLDERMTEVVRYILDCNGLSYEDA